jgi:hypothetical protein
MLLASAPMIRGIDHLVIACHDPDATAAELEALVGIRCTGGGRHERLGTFNRLAWLADGSYLELIGVEDRELALTQPIGAAAVRALDGPDGGLATYALEDDDLAATLDRLRPTASTFEMLHHGSRRRADGVAVEWWWAAPGQPLAADATPFLIQHVEDEGEWSVEGRLERRRIVHPVGSVVALIGIDVASEDPAGAVQAITRDLALAPTGTGAETVMRFGTHEVRLTSRDASTPATTVRLRASVPSPVASDLLGVRFEIAGG